MNKLHSASGSILNKIMCNFERIALQNKCEFISLYKFEPSVLMYDGVMAENVNNVLVDDEFLKKCSQFIFGKQIFR